MAGEVELRFRNLEITPATLVLHFYDNKTVVPVAQIKSYQLHWHLHDPTFGKKWWFLVLTVELDNGQEESAPVAFVKSNYVEDDVESRRHIERKLADALDSVIARRAASAQKMVDV